MAVLGFADDWVLLAVCPPLTVAGPLVVALPAVVFDETVRAGEVVALASTVRLLVEGLEHEVWPLLRIRASMLYSLQVFCS